MSPCGLKSPALLPLAAVAASRSAAPFGGAPFQMSHLDHSVAASTRKSAMRSLATREERTH
eukprot:8046344-Alexandrium_andersonii.AAC.1